MVKCPQQKKEKRYSQYEFSDSEVVSKAIS